MRGTPLCSGRARREFYTPAWLPTGELPQFEHLEQLDFAPRWANTPWKGGHESQRSIANRRRDSPR